jgi:hypothetical protein
VNLNSLGRTELTKPKRKKKVRPLIALSKPLPLQLADAQCKPPFFQLLL